MKKLRATLGSAPVSRGLWRGLKAAHTKILHPVRRRAAVAKIRRLRPRPRILVLCHGNICRSPYCAGRLNGAGSKPIQLEVESAGFIGPGRRSPDIAVEVASGRGVDMVRHESKLVSPDLVEWADLVVVMDIRQAKRVISDFQARESSVVILGDLDPSTPSVREIPDPIDRPREVFREVYARIDRCVDTLVDSMSGSS